SGVLLFCFQAEDGIRDRNVTGVQTCALPIFRLFGGLIKSMWTSVRSVFSTVIKWIVEFVKNRFTAMSNTISTITTTIRNVISRIWNAILSFFRNIIKSIVDFVKQRFTNLKNNVTNIFTGIRDMAKRVWNKTKDNIVNPIKNGVN